MPLTPAEVHSAAFRRPRPGGRGYHEDDVDAFLDDVADEMLRLAAENRTLSDRLTHEDLAERIRRLELECLRSQEHALALQAELEQLRAAQAPVRLDDPRMLEVARRNADEYVAEARREAEALVEHATTKAGQLVSEAQLRASTIVADARHAHAEAVSGIEEQRTAALDEIGELTELVERRRTEIAEAISGRLRDLTG
ncbi:DivIVA domain-containing protein [Actinoplanes regularis]|uniref:DivIVA domain-containing protein n=1 Tax=Actinoplanes regularis TaxID=52697 RepID=UPI00249FEC21|nr:DivIVA domain-containing protein [Actinoplanes regularis]GLW35953.1 cell wall synthesis protein Wag31 [Actinoplanes regularis]